MSYHPDHLVNVQIADSLFRCRIGPNGVTNLQGEPLNLPFVGLADLTAGQAAILEAIATAAIPPKTGDLAKSVGDERGNTTREYATRLVKMGLIKNKRPGYVLTEKGLLWYESSKSIDNL